MSQEWPAILCRQLCTGIELALQEQSRQQKSKSFPYTEGGSTGSGSLSYKDVKELQCGACLRNRPRTDASHTRVEGNCRHPWKDMRVWHACAACRGHKAQNDPSHAKIEHECRFADAHVNQRNAARSTKGSLPPLARVIETDGNEHGAPRPIHIEPVFISGYK